MFKIWKKRKTVHTNKKVLILSVVTLMLVAVAAGIFVLVNNGKKYYADTKKIEAEAEELKASLNEFVENIKKGEYEAADKNIQKIDGITSELRTELNDPKWEMVSKVPEVGPDLAEDFKTASKLLDLVSEASDTLMKPAVKFLREKGLPDKKTFTMKKILSPEFAVMLGEYADLIDTLCPAAEKVLTDFDELPEFKIEKLESKISKYRVLVKENESDVRAYIKFLKDLSKDLLRPAAVLLNGKGLSLGDEKITDILGPKLASQLNVYADLIEQLFPVADRVLADFSKLPKIKIEKVESKISKFRQLTDNQELKELKALLEEAPDALLRPAAEVMNNTPFSALKTKDGIDTRVIKAYIELADKVKPYILKAGNSLKESSFLKDQPELQQKIVSKLDSIEPLLEEFDKYKPLVNLVLGDGRDKLYVIVAMNSAEIRASGGFPGSIGTVTIKKGILKFGKFTGVRKKLTYKARKLISSTRTEDLLFKRLGFGTKVTSASLNPHFPRVAQIIAKGYKKKNKLKKLPDGVIAVTPHILGRLIGITEPIKLSNGKKLDSKYAIKYLQRDIYFQYFKGKKGKQRRKANEKTNALFAEAANKTLNNVMSDLSLDKIKALFNVVKKSSQDRVFMMWMSNKKAQNTVRSLGYSGSLNYNKKKPEIGVFYNIYDANKLGPYLDMKVTVGKGKKNKNGTITYPVTVKVKNCIDRKSIKQGRGNDYLTSKKGGASMRSIAYFFAPAGGTITGFSTNRYDVYMRKAKYQKLNVLCTTKFYLMPRQSATFKFKITTAKGVKTKPKVVHMPLLSAYRHAKQPK